MEEREQALERGEGRRAAVLVAVVQPRLDRLGVPVAEVVERQVVEGAGRGGEVEPRPVVLERRPRRVEAREDPALLERGRPPGGLDALGVLEDQARDVPELVRELAALLDRAAA